MASYVLRGLKMYQQPWLIISLTEIFFNNQIRTLTCEFHCSSKKEKSNYGI